MNAYMEESCEGYLVIEDVHFGERTEALSSTHTFDKVRPGSEYVASLLALVSIFTLKVVLAF